MDKETKAEKDANVLTQFNTLKEKHPDALLMFRRGDFYEMYKQDAVKTAAILAIAIADRIIPGEKEPLKVASFPYTALDIYLPKLIRSGERVAICDSLEENRQKKVEKEQEKKAENKSEVKEIITPNQRDMAKKKTEQGKQEEPAKTVRNAAEEKPATEQKAKAKVNTKSAEEKPATEKKSTEKQATAQAEAKPQASPKGGEEAQATEAKKERKPREPQMVTPNGEKVTHGHAYQSKTNPEDWYFTAKIDGKQLKPQKMEAADLAAYQKKEIAVPQLMERYYPTKIMPKVAEDAYKMPASMKGPEGNITVEKFNVYKEKDEQRQDFGKYKFYAQVDGARMSVVASKQDLNAYFDRVATPQQLVERNFGERLHLKSAYEKYRLPEGVDPQGVRVAKDHADNKWKVSVDMGDKGQTGKQAISFDDGYALFKSKTATREQIAAKYLNNEITGMLSAHSVKVQQSASMKM